MSLPFWMMMGGADQQRRRRYGRADRQPPWDVADWFLFLSFLALVACVIAYVVFGYRDKQEPRPDIPLVVASPGTTTPPNTTAPSPKLEVAPPPRPKSKRPPTRSTPGITGASVVITPDGTVTARPPK